LREEAISAYRGDYQVLPDVDAALALQTVSSGCRAPASPRARNAFRSAPASVGSLWINTPAARLDTIRFGVGASASAASTPRLEKCRGGVHGLADVMATGTSVGLIGCGGIAQDVVAALRASPANGVSIVGALARPGRGEEARAKLCEIDIVETLDALLARKPAIVAEVAGQAAVVEHGENVLRRGIDCLVISVGALADPALLARLKSAAHDGNSRILLPAGAWRYRCYRGNAVAGSTSVRYRSRKPRPPGVDRPPSRRSSSTSSRSGPCSTRAAPAKLHCYIRRTPMSPPRLRLAGLGFDATEVGSSPIPTRPATCEIEAEGAAGRFAIQLQGKPSRSNPKTSALAAMSVARALINAHATIVI
jgi:aspartate dehydrogenase